jgi:MoxR-like ATPase
MGDPTAIRSLAQNVRAEVGKAVVGQDDAIESLLIGLITGGHVLLEGVPGTAKTLMARSLAFALDASFKRC